MFACVLVDMEIQTDLQSKFDATGLFDARYVAFLETITHLRPRQVREEAEAAAVGPETFLPVETPGREIDRAVERLVVNLPPKERACVLLKDVFEYSLDEIADLVDSTVGGVGRPQSGPR